MAVEDKEMQMRKSDKRKMLMSLKDEAEPTKKLHRKKNNKQVSR